jgi:hypothetical protein
MHTVCGVHIVADGEHELGFGTRRRHVEQASLLVDVVLFLVGVGAGVGRTGKTG